MAKKRWLRCNDNKCNHEFSSGSEKPRCSKCNGSEFTEIDSPKKVPKEKTTKEPYPTNTTIPNPPSGPPSEEGKPDQYTQAYKPAAYIDQRTYALYDYWRNEFNYTGDINAFINESTQLMAKQLHGISPAIIKDTVTGKESVNMSKPGNGEKNDDPDRVRQAREIAAMLDEEQLREVMDTRIEGSKLKLDERRIELDKKRKDLKDNGEGDDSKDPDKSKRLKELMEGDQEDKIIDMKIRERELDMEKKELDLEEKRAKVENLKNKNNNGGGNTMKQTLPAEKIITKPDGSVERQPTTVEVTVPTGQGMGMYPFMNQMGNPYAQQQGQGNFATKEDIGTAVKEAISEKTQTDEMQKMRDDMHDMELRHRDELDKEREKRQEIRDTKILEEVEEAKRMAQGGNESDLDRYVNTHEKLKEKGLLKESVKDKETFDRDQHLANMEAKVIEKATKVLDGVDGKAKEVGIDLIKEIVQKTIKDITPEKKVEEYTEEEMETMYHNVQTKLGTEQLEPENPQLPEKATPPSESQGLTGEITLGEEEGKDKKEKKEDTKKKDDKGASGMTGEV